MGWGFNLKNPWWEGYGYFLEQDIKRLTKEVLLLTIETKLKVCDWLISYNFECDWRIELSDNKLYDLS